MTTDEFVSKYNGKTIDFDGVFGGQCMDLYRQFVKEVLGFPQSPPVTGAYQVWDTYLSQYFDRIDNTPSGIPQKGDILIWGQSVGKYGHIAVYLEGNTSSFKSFDQNWPVGTNCHIQSHNYNGLLGWLTPRSNMNGLKLWDNNGQVWAEFDNKQFYVENPKSIEGLSIVKGQPSGEILIKQKDQDARLAQLRSEMQGQIDARDVQIKGLNAKIEQLKDEKVTLKAQVDEYKKEIELLKDLLQDESEASTSCEADRDKLQKQIDEHKCEVKEMTAWEHFREFISKLIERK